MVKASTLSTIQSVLVVFGLGASLLGLIMGIAGAILYGSEKYQEGVRIWRERAES